MTDSNSNKITNLGCLILFLGAIISLILFNNNGHNIKNNKPNNYSKSNTIYKRSPAEQAGYDWANKNDLFDHDLCRGNSDAFVQGCRDYVEEAMIKAGCKEENAFERCDFE